MFVNNFLLLSTGSPFYQAYTGSDLFGKCIFLSIIATSICAWTVLLYKWFFLRKVERNTTAFARLFSQSRQTPLELDDSSLLKKEQTNPSCAIYLILKKNTIELLKKNRQFGGSADARISYLCPEDIDYISAHLSSAMNLEMQTLEKNLFILSTIVGLAPLLGLLGTVWGILIAFSEIQSHSSVGSNQMILGGIALALTTTVLGLLSAIPAQIGYNYLKNAIRSFEVELESLVNQMLSSIEIQYRKIT